MIALREFGPIISGHVILPSAKHPCTSSGVEGRPLSSRRIILYAMMEQVCVNGCNQGLFPNISEENSRAPLSTYTRLHLCDLPFSPPVSLSRLHREFFPIVRDNPSPLYIVGHWGPLDIDSPVVRKGVVEVLARHNLCEQHRLVSLHQLN